MAVRQGFVDDATSPDNGKVIYTAVTVPADLAADGMTLVEYLKSEGITQFKYTITQAGFTYEPGVYGLSFVDNAFSDAAGNQSVATSAIELVVEGATAALVNPGQGAAIDINLLGARSYIDITFPSVPTEFHRL